MPQKKLQIVCVAFCLSVFLHRKRLNIYYVEFRKSHVEKTALYQIKKYFVFTSRHSRIKEFMLSAAHFSRDKSQKLDIAGSKKYFYTIVHVALAHVRRT